MVKIHDRRRFSCEETEDREVHEQGEGLLMLQLHVQDR